ncbi:MAG: Hsp20/alpha crystallin family protein [Deltaproteobacteria bacterium]|nr:Hsp20/alpha crystallin family protein [Deltaproteobacteria bacterium]
MMAPLSRKLFREIQEMQMQTGRMLRNMSFTRMAKIESGLWQPPVDIYESGEEITVYCDLAGVMKDSLELLVEEHQLHISGRRQLPRTQVTAREGIVSLEPGMVEERPVVCIHQLEIELGAFARTVALPVIIDVEQASSFYLDGILVVSLKKRVENQIIVRIQVEG